MRHRTIPLPTRSTLERFELACWSFGEADAKPWVHLQAGLHSNEIPPLLVAVHLQKLLADFEHEGRIRGRVTIVPVANPIGLSQRVLGRPEGRYDLADGANFNRDFPDIYAATRAQLGSAGSAAPSEDAVLAALRCSLAEMPAATVTQSLRVALLGKTLGADLVLDLHSAVSGVLHLVCHEAFAEPMRELAARMGAAAVLTVSRESPTTFDEAASLPRLRLAKDFPQASVRPTMAATVELRGNRDVSDELAERDAKALIDNLAALGVVNAPLGARSSSVPIVASESLISVDAPIPGIIVLRCSPGDYIAQGTTVAEIVDPSTGERHALSASESGQVLITHGDHFAHRGASIVQIVPLADRGASPDRQPGH